MKTKPNEQHELQEQLENANDPIITIEEDEEYISSIDDELIDTQEITPSHHTVIALVSNYAKPAFMYLISSITLTLFIKFTVSSSSVDVHYPLTFLCLQNVLNTVSSGTVQYYLKSARMEATHTPRQIIYSMFHKETFKQLIPYGIMAGLDYGISSLSFMFISVSLYTILKCSVPIFVMMGSFALGIEKPGPVLIISVFVISTGVAMAVAGSVSFHLGGFLLVLAATVIAAARLVYVQNVLQKSMHDHIPSPTITTDITDEALATENDQLTGAEPKKEEVTGMQVFFYSAPIVSLTVLPFALLIEIPRMIKHFNNLQSNNDTVIGTSTNGLLYLQFRFVLECFGIVLTGAIFAFFVNVSEYVLIKRASSLTFTVVGIIKEIILIIAASIILGEVLTATNSVGCLLSIAGLAIFQIYRLQQVMNKRSEVSTSTNVEFSSIATQIDETESHSPNSCLEEEKDRDANMLTQANKSVTNLDD